MRPVELAEMAKWAASMLANPPQAKRLCAERLISPLTNTDEVVIGDVVDVIGSL
jgi:hypothetical protein